jgi:hypothetical protein
MTLSFSHIPSLCHLMCLAVLLQINSCFKRGVIENYFTLLGVKSEGLDPKQGNVKSAKVWENTRRRTRDMHEGMRVKVSGAHGFNNKCTSCPLG